MEERTKSALTAMRKILRVTEFNSKSIMRQTGLTPSQLVFIQMIDDGREHTAGSIATRMGTTQATTTALIHKLEALGAIQRRKGDTDKRQVWLSLTEKGQRILHIAPDGVHAHFHNAFSALEEWEQLMLTASLERVATMLGDAASEELDTAGPATSLQATNSEPTTPEPTIPPRNTP